MASIKEIEDFEKVWNEFISSNEGKEAEKELIAAFKEIDFSEWWKQHYNGIDKVMTPEKAIEFLESKLKAAKKAKAFDKVKIKDEHIEFIKFEIERHKMRAEKNSNIETLTKEKLLEYGFKEQQINEILSNSSYEGNCINNNGQYWVSMIEGKIYSGEEYYAKGFKMIFPNSADFLPEYYNRKLSDFIVKTKEFEKGLFNEMECKEQFKKNEIEFVEDCLKQREKFKGLQTMVNENKLYHLYLAWIKRQVSNVAKIETKPFFPDLNNKEQFPVLHGLFEHLKSRLPQKDIIQINNQIINQFNQLRELPEAKTDNEGNFILDEKTEQQIKQHIEIVLSTIKQLYISVPFAETNLNYIESLINERDGKLSINVINASHSIREYNKRAIKEIERFIMHVYSYLEIKLYPYFNEPEKQALKLDILFDNMRKQFEEIEKAETITAGITIKGKGKRKPITAPVLGLFCSIIEQCNFDILGDESKADFCKRVCNTYNQKYTERVWRAYFKNMDIKLRDKNLIALKEYILPDLKADTRQKIEQLITNKTKTFV